MNDGIRFSITASSFSIYNKNALRIIFKYLDYVIIHIFFPVCSLIENRGQKMISLGIAIIFLKYLELPDILSEIFSCDENMNQNQNK